MDFTKRPTSLSKSKSASDGNFLRSALKKNKKIILNGNEINKNEFKKCKNLNKLKHNLINIT